MPTPTRARILRAAVVVVTAALAVQAATPAPQAAVDRLPQAQLARLFELHAPRVYRRALRLLGNPADAEEATQEVFVRVMKGADGFRGDAQVTTWLYQVTTNYCLNQLRDRARRRDLFDTRVAAAADETGPARSDDLVLLRRLLSGADERQAQAAVYVFLDGLSHDEAAELLGVSRRTVGNLLERFTEQARAASGEPTDGGRS